MSKTDNNYTHLAGEYFVAAELSRHGCNIGITIGNAKAIDIFAEIDGKPINIQVKAIKNKKSIGFTISQTSDIKDYVLYIFANLNDLESPDYYICYPYEVREDFKQYKGRGIVNLYSLNARLECKNNWASVLTY